MKYLAGLMIALVIYTVFLSSCAVMMAASGKKNQDISMLTPGIPREHIILKLGPPETSDIDEEGNYIESYLIVKGNEPSPGRAIMHDELDYATFGLWEIIGTPIELIAGSESYTRATIYYDKDQRVRDIQFEELEKIDDSTGQIDSNKTGGIISGTY